MKLTILWNEQTDYAREVREWMRDFLHDTGRDASSIVSLDPETRAGESFAEAYDILQYPAVVVTDDDGRLLSLWKGTPMPQIDEVAYFAKAE